LFNFKTISSPLAAGKSLGGSMKIAGKNGLGQKSPWGCGKSRVPKGPKIKPTLNVGNSMNIQAEIKNYILAERS